MKFTASKIASAMGAGGYSSGVFRNTKGGTNEKVQTQTRKDGQKRVTEGTGLLSRKIAQAMTAPKPPPKAGKGFVQPKTSPATPTPSSDPDATKVPTNDVPVDFRRQLERKQSGKP
jgi:hypothetical protein